MFEIEPRDREELSDVRGFVELVSTGAGGFSGDRDIWVARAPGRLDVMGGIADYSGSLVLPMPIAEACLAGVQRSTDGIVRIVSVGEERLHSFEIAAERLSELFDRRHRGKWYSYIAGVFAVLADTKGADFSKGVRVLVRSDVPIGKGVSSSASLEVSVMNAVCAAFGIDIEPRELAILCQRVENTIVGAACGLMDQVASNCGVEGSMLSLVCQSAEIGEPLKIPDGLDVWGIDSGVRHSVSGSDYSSVRAATFMGYRMLPNAAGNVANWNGYLANVSIEEYESSLGEDLPESMTGGEFLERFQEHNDTVTTIDPDTAYAIRACAEHAIYESARVKEFASLLVQASQPNVCQRLGGLMFESHASYRRCGLTEDGTDLLASLAAERRSNGVYGARITGGGSGGTVAILADSNAGDAVEEIASEYQRRTGRNPKIFHGSSPGCHKYGVVRLVPSSLGN
ncbi:MAG: galactokinase family protein [Pyrinomonadaceae bacterium]